MTPIIRKATAADADALLQLVRECVAGMRAAGIEQWDEIYPNAENIGRDLEAGTLDVMCQDGGIIASITVDRNMDPLWRDLNWSNDGEPAAAVHRLMVHPSQQGRGHGRCLMLHAEVVGLVERCSSIRLDTFLQNPAAMALYPRLGYRPTGIAMMRKGEFMGFEKMLSVPDSSAALPSGAKEFTIRAMRDEDIPAALALWRMTEGVGQTPEETPAMLAGFLERNPDISSAVLDARGRLIGAVIGGHDGRRGYLYHLAVEHAHRGCGLGRALVERTAAQMAGSGLAKANIMVFAHNSAGHAFWERHGWRAREDLELRQKDL